VGLVADLHLAVRPCDEGHEVWHLEGARVKATLKPSTRTAKSQTRVMSVPDSGGTLGLHYAPTTAELLAAKAKLKKTATQGGGGIPLWALSEFTGVDLSFLDDDD